MSSRTSRSIYFSSRDAWAILECPPGEIPPPSFTVTLDGVPHLLVYRGPPGDLFIRLNYRYTQAELASAAGVGQQAVSRYVNGRSEPRLDPTGWASIIGLCLEAG